MNSDKFDERAFVIRLLTSNPSHMYVYIKNMLVIYKHIKDLPSL